MTVSLRRCALLVALLASATPSALAAPALAVDASAAKPEVRFNANGEPGALDIDARTSEVTITDDGQTVTFVVPLANVSTGIDLRDEHMKSKFLEVGTFPTASLAVARAALTFPTEVGKKASGSVPGQFTAHGVTQPTTVKWDIKKTKTGFQMTGSFAFDISQHGIAVPSYLGVTVDSKMTARAVIYAVETP